VADLPTRVVSERTFRSSRVCLRECWNCIPRGMVSYGIRRRTMRLRIRTHLFRVLWSSDSGCGLVV
jgi:hypothetical protein